ncbi:tetratricopeptide repeat protein [Flavobacteriaceae bacterium MHTCC 0001]
MNTHDFIALLQNPQEITLQKTKALQTIIQQYPYFQSVKALHLKGLKAEASSDYNQALKTTAAYTTDRSILFDFITSEEFLQNEISKAIKRNSVYLNEINVKIDDISVNKKLLIDDKLNQQIKDTSLTLDPELFYPKPTSKIEHIHFELDESQNIETATEDTKTQNASAKDILNIGKPLEFERSETHSFNEWLKLTKIKPIQREEAPEAVENHPEALSNSSTPDTKNKLVDRFIADNPKITPATTNTPKGNLAKERMTEPKALMTETLARIYLEQKNYKKAIQSYKILSLKYPEKSGFFADQIKAVEQLQEQNKKE